MTDNNERGSLKDKIDDMAHAIADSVIDGKPVDKQELDAFKALCQYEARDRKPKGLSGDEAQGGFDEWQRDIDSAGTVPDRH